MKDLVTLTAEAFASGGPLEQVLTEHGRSYTFNSKQVEYADLTAKGLLGEEYQANLGEEAREALGGNPVRGLTTLLQGSTGIGKTLGYLIPICLHLALTGRKGLVSTYTLHLQRQIIREDFEIAAGVARLMTGASLTVAPLKGRRNFISPQRVRDLVAALQVDGKLDDETAALLKSLETFPSGDIAEWKESLDFPPNVKAADICLLPGSPPVEASAYFAHKEAAADADLMIVTHALLLRSCLTWNVMFGPGDDALPPFDVAVVDEADRIPVAAESIFTARVSVPMVQTVAAALEACGIEGLSPLVLDWHEWMDTQFAELSSKYSSGFRQDGSGGYVILGGARIDDLRTQARDWALQIKDKLLNGAGYVRLAKKMPIDEVEDIYDIARQLDDFVKGCDDPGGTHSTPVIRWSPVKTFGAFTTVPIYPGRLVARLWRKREKSPTYLRSLILTSATLDAPGGSKALFSGFRDLIGLNAKFDHYNAAGSASLAPAKFGKMGFVLADRRVPKPSTDDEEDENSDPEWISYAARGIAQAYSRGGRSLVLLTSYRDTEAIAEEARGLGVALIAQKRGERIADHLPAFQSPDNPNGVLITPTGWEGLNLPGILSHVIIPRVPFPMRDNARSRALVERLMTRRGYSEGRASGTAYLQNSDDARRKLEQGIGRGIRSYTDSVTLWILDPRFPLPSSITTNRKLRQRNWSVAAYLQLSACIPERFRSGLFSPYEDAEILLLEDILVPAE